MRPPKNTIYRVKNTDNKITQLRKKAHLTQEALAHQIGMAVSTVRRWEQGQCEPTMQVWQMKAFCEAVHVKFEHLPPLLARL
ncbi:helix-turn-helix transcriptional regulator [Pleurocapsa sp. PCC 7319]|uniref:helix-turn-helix domain-containing protein n=1 Tax=Pleurocapsa sp. PCC 7319 TaxID=118161 RepID=UPI000346CC5F|nr:helix-turn-helix transcriptional regulator [Pleurocapsa sp. PCC 7319]